MAKKKQKRAVKSLGMKRAIVRIPLCDDEDSPVFTLDMRDESVGKKAAVLYEKYLEMKPELEAVENGSKEEGNIEAVIALWKTIIDSMLGDGAFDATVAFIADGEDVKPSEMILLISPLVYYLLEQMEDILTANRSAAFEKYVNKGRSRGKTL